MTLEISKQGSESDLRNIVERARVFAMEKHKGQLDDDGWPYIFHPDRVACIIREITEDQDLIAAAYLHDTIEDTSTTYDELVRSFGSIIADLVMEVTHEGKKDEYGYWFPRLKTKKGIMLKFADRLSNLSRMGSWDEKRKEHYLKKSKFWKSEGLKQKEE